MRPIEENLIRIIFTYDKDNHCFIRTCLNSDLALEAKKYNFSVEDLYWLKQERISFDQASDFFLTASTWSRRFNNLIVIKADIEKTIMIDLLEASEKQLILDLKWLYPVEQIKEIYSPMGFVIVNTELLSGIAPEYLSSDLHESGLKTFQGIRLKRFLEKEWQLLKPFMTTRKEILRTLFIDQRDIQLKKDGQDSIYLAVEDKRLVIDDLPVVYDRFGFINTKIGLLYGDHLFNTGIRFNKSYFTGFALTEANLCSENKTNANLISVEKPNSWFYHAGFLNSQNASDINLAGNSDFIYLAKQTIPANTKPEVVKVIRKIKDILNQSSNNSFQDYLIWRDSFLMTGEAGKESFYALILMQEIINELLEIQREEKYQLFWPLWQCMARYGSREDKGRFIEAALDWSLIEGYYGIYGYISTLKNGFMHNALLWQAFLPENRDALEPEICAEMAIENINQGIFVKKPEQRAIISKVFGCIDDYYRGKTGVTFLASFHPTYFSRREYVPYKDQIYAGYCEKIVIAELEPLVFHQPLIDFSKAIFLAIQATLTSTNNTENIKLPEALLQIIENVVTNTSE